MLKTLSKGLIISLMIGCVSTVAAQSDYPEKPIKIVVPFPPGGTTDALARMLAQSMSENLGQPTVVENKVGAGATIGADYVAKADPDGYTLLVGAAHHTIAQNVYKDLPYDFGRDLTGVGIIALVPNVVVVNASVPAKTVEELVALAKSKPGQINYGTAGVGTAHHLFGEMFKLSTDTDIVHVPYKGSAPAVADLVGGQVQLMFDTVTSALPQIKAGKTRALAVTTGKRSTALPDVPTLGETVIPGFDYGTWFGIMAPAGTPQPILEKLNAEIVRMVTRPETRKQLIDMGTEPVGNSIKEMNDQVKAELTQYGVVAKKIGLAPE